MSRSKKIVGLLKDRDTRGLELLYDNYAHALLGISYRVLDNKELAEDTLQKGLMKVWDNIDKYDENKGGLFTWMSTIIRNLSLDVRRSKQFIQSTKNDPIDKSIYQIQASVNDSSKLDTDKLLNGLEDKYKIVLEYLYLKGYTQKELAEEKNIPLGTVKTRLKKAIDIIRKNLGPETQFGQAIKVTILFTLISLIL